MKHLTVLAIALVMSAHVVCGQDDLARVNDEEIQSIKAFARQVASNDELEFERGRAAFYDLRRDAATYPLIVAELLPLIADRAVDQDGQIRQGKIVDLLEHAGPQGKTAADILLKHALDTDAYFHLRGQCMQTAAAILKDDPRVQDAALTILEQPGSGKASSPYDSAIFVISKYGVDSSRTSAVLARMLEHPYRQLQDSAFVALGNLQLRQNPMTLDQAIEAMQQPREFSDRELSAVLTV